MPYREVHIGRETFVTRISDEAVQEWLDKREHLRNRGYPDRPPDIDTPLTRSWIAHPHEKTKIEMEVANSEIPASYPVYSLSFNINFGHDLVVHKILVSAITDTDEYIVRILAIWQSNGDTAFDRTLKVPHSDFVKLFPEILESAAKLIAEDEIPFITTCDEYKALEDESNLAQKELDEYYGKTMVN